MFDCILSKMPLFLSLGGVVYNPDCENTTFIPHRVRRYKIDLTINAYSDFMEAYRIVTA